MDVQTWNMVLDTADDYFDRGELGLADELHGAGIAAEVAPDPARWGEIMRRQGRCTGHSRLLDLFAAGASFEPGLAVVMPIPPSADSPARQFCDRMEIDGVVCADGAHTLVVGTDTGTYRVPTEAVRLTALDGFDPEAGWCRVTGTIAAKLCSTLDDGGWPDVRRRAAIALSWELIGVAEAAFAAMSEYASTREQFGAAMTQFQTVRHRIVDVHVQLRAALDAVEAVSSDDDLGWMIAKALAGRAARESCAAAQQLCGGMGFTWEFGLHRAVRRVLVVDQLLGGHQVTTARIGAELGRRREAPQLAALVN